ncbi:MAG: Cysteine desulfuration protein SufE [candidate division BRC1 bacterium ADurb.BinA364]|nr:MAG: Cysteine desulfuration protein SufE [candidate division BRC1 bacterium ADurb.BinA364]
MPYEIEPFADYTPDLLLENFDLLGEWEERYRYLIDLGKKLPPLPESAKVEENRVDGCQSNVWMTFELAETGGSPRLRFEADSDAHIVRGLIAVLMICYNNQTLDMIDRYDIRGFFSRLGLDRHLSPTRSNGFYSMVERIRTMARQDNAQRHR